MASTDYGRAYEGKSILVTGGAGSVGGALVRRLLEYGPKVVRILDQDENGLFLLKEDLPANARVRYLLGHVQDRERLQRALEGIDVVFHAAALKHIPFCEYNAFEAVQVNILGTQNVIEACLDNGVGRMITISTDKAVNPTSNMGTTKLLAERITIDGNHYHGTKPSRFSCVRFGNVLGSRGSIVPVLKHRVSRGEPVEITHPDMTRFLMTVDEAVDLVLKAGALMQGGEVFILKSMGSFRVGDLIELGLEELVTQNGQSLEGIQARIVGPRKGEKMHEELMTESEAARALETEDMYILLPDEPALSQGLDVGRYPTVAPSSRAPRDSLALGAATKEELRAFLRSRKIFET